MDESLKNNRYNNYISNFKGMGRKSMTETITYEPRWNLDSIFSGGSKSKDFHVYLEEVERNLNTLNTMIESFDPINTNLNASQLKEITDQMEVTTKKLREASAFISCLSAQDVNDAYADLLVGKRSQLQAVMSASRTKFGLKLALVTDEIWQKLLEQGQVNELAFILNEKREEATDLLSEKEEILIDNLAVDGYHAWNQMYGTIVGKMKVNIEEDGKVHSYSVGQAANKLNHPNREVRKHVYEQLQKAWSEHADFFGQTLNHLAGFSLQTYKHRGWMSVLKEPLAINRMKQETLDAMWTAISNNKEHFVKFLKRKADLLGLEKLSFYDIGAPLANSVKTSTYTEGAYFIIDQFKKFSAKMASFAKMAFEKRWIEAENRPGKRPGGFCTSFPDSEQTRIFMTYSGTSSNIATLAHELGHAYHQHV